MPPRSSTIFLQMASPQPRADPRTLGRVERLEDPGGVLGLHAGPGVAHLGAHAIAIAPGPHADLVLVDVAVSDRVRGVDQQVQEHLRELPVRGEHQRHPTEVFDQSRAVLDLVVHHHERVLDGLLEVGRRQGALLGAREGPETAGDPLDPDRLRRGRRVAERLFNRLAGRHPACAQSSMDSNSPHPRPFPRGS